MLESEKIKMRGRGFCPCLSLSKKWRSHFFEKAALRYAPRLSACGGQFDARYAQSVFSDAGALRKRAGGTFLAPAAAAMPRGGNLTPPGMATPLPGHCSVNDISVLGFILSDMDGLMKEPKKKPQAPQPPPPRKKAVSKQERNAEILAKVQYNFVFTPDSSVFHRPSCKMMLRANDILGAVYYETAAKKRRPCKLCRPEPVDVVAVSKKKAPKPKSPAPVKKPQSELVLARLLGNQRKLISKDKLIGHCHLNAHPGRLTVKLMKAHHCVEKECAFFEKYEDRPYWIALEKKRGERGERKAAKQHKKLQERQTSDELEEMRGSFQQYADEFGYNLLIVRVQRETKRYYRVFYVSENKFADANRFPSFTEKIRALFPECWIELRHIRDVDGRFVTIDEYRARKRK